MTSLSSLWSRMGIDEGLFVWTYAEYQGGVHTLIVIISWKRRLHNGHSLVTLDHSKMQLKQNIWEQHGKEALWWIVWRQIAKEKRIWKIIRQSALSSFEDRGRPRLLLEDGTIVWIQLKSIPMPYPKRRTGKRRVAKKTKENVKRKLFPPFVWKWTMSVLTQTKIDDNRECTIQTD